MVVFADQKRMGIVLIRGGGDLASGVALRCWRAGFQVVITELAEPQAVRRTVSFSEAIYDVSIEIEGVTGTRADPSQISELHSRNEIPVLIDPEADILKKLEGSELILIDARMLKLAPVKLPTKPYLYIGLGPGFVARINCDAVIETHRGHTLGRVYWSGSVMADSRVPDGDPRRLLRATIDGIVMGYKKIGDHCEPGELIAEIQDPTDKKSSSKLYSPISGVLRGLIHPGIRVTVGMKIGDIDPRDNPSYCHLVSDKALAVGGGVLEAIFSTDQARA